MHTEIETANALIESAFSCQNEELDMSSGFNNNDRPSINLETTIDILMHNVGRFCEAHLNDFIITWDSVKDALNYKTQGTDIIAFGIRQHGVDSNLFIYSRVKDHKHQADWASTYYRKIFAVKIQRELETAVFGQTPDDQMVISVVLKDITDYVRYDEQSCKTNHDSVPSENTDPHYARLQIAYNAYNNNQAFTPETPAAVSAMNRYLRFHQIAPNIHSIASLTSTMCDYKQDEDDWHSASAENWEKYCDRQIGLIAAILLLRTQNL